MKYIDRKYIVEIGIVVVFLGCFSACKKFVQLPTSSYQIQASAVFADSTDATAALVGIYENMMTSDQNYDISNGGVTLFTGMSGDEITYTGANAALLQFYQNAINSQTNGDNTSYLYDLVYQNGGMIYPANAVIAGVTSSKTLTATLKSQLIGEAELLRAFAYFNLVNLYGPARW